MAGENQYSVIKSFGDHAYPPFWMRSADGLINLVAKYIFLENYSETYTADYKFEHIFGKINPIPEYGNTDRTINIEFNMGARNVHEAKKNLDYCRLLARTVYGVYAVTGYNTDTGQVDHSYETQRRYIINFGTFLRDQIVEILSFDFTIDFDAGVFDYGSTPVGAGALTVGERSDAHWENLEGPSSLLKEDAYVYHGGKGAVLPKSVSVKLSMRAFHKNPLGFGGEIRPDGSLGWSLNENLDWPHGTGPIPAAGYCKRDTEAAPGEEGRNNGANSEDVVDDTFGESKGPIEDPEGRF